MNNIESKLKKEFQIERMILFSDAVFAIAITLLIIEIKPPHSGDKYDITLLNQLLNMTPKFIGFLVSFLVVGQYWITHHKLFGFVKDYNTKLLWLNLFFLLTIVFMPFSSALYSENIFVNLSFIIYSLNIVITGLFNFWLWRYVGNPKNNLSEHLDNKVLLNFYSFRAFIIPTVFLIAIPISIINPWIAKFSPILIFPLMKYARKKYSSVLR